MKIQLFVPPRGYIARRWERERSSMPPLGILFLAAVLEKKGVEVDVVPSDVLGFGWKEVESRIADFRPDAVGVTTTTENRFDSFELVRTAKRIRPQALTMLGGPHTSMAREDTMRFIPEVDIAVMGEAETTVSELVDALEAGDDLSKVKGLLCRKDGRVLFTGTRPPIADLDDLPFPARHLVPMEKYNFTVDAKDGRRLKAQNIMTSRGCPFNCYFCATPVNWGRKMRGHSPERVLKEIEHLIENHGAEYIWFYDDTLNYNPERVHEIMDMMIERRLPVKFCNEFRIDLVDKPLLEKMVRAGLVWGHFGIEAGSARVRRDVVHKKIDIEQAYQFVRWAGELGFVPDAFLIFSHHTETWEEAQETLAVMEEMKAINPRTEFATAILHVYPGTPLEKLARDEGIIPKDFSWSRKRDLRKVPILPAAQGYVPLFKHRLSWFQIAGLVMRMPGKDAKALSGSTLKSAFRTLISWRSLGVYFVFFIRWVSFRLNRIFSSRKNR